MLEIESVVAASIAEELDLEAGDCLLSINGVDICDQIDYQLQAQGEEFFFEVQKKNGELWDIEFERDYDDPIGLEFAYPQPRQCQNNCQFCFVRQLPAGLRKSLYVRDDDFRFSYLYGAYITLTNLTEQDIERIISQKLSPLYVSVHATDVKIRSSLMGRELPPVLPILQRLIAGGIKLHTQIVLCPQQNDADCLEQSVLDLFNLYPGILSLAIVPVGLSKYREQLAELRCFSSLEAREVVEQIHRLQGHCLGIQNTRFVFAGDELYLKANWEFPSLAAYEDLSLLENGVGLVPLFRHETAEMLNEAGCYAGITATIVTGESAAAEMKHFVQQFNARTQADLRVQVIHNDFFGSQVTVAGLLVGRDIVAQLADVYLGSVLMIPDVMCREGDEVLLDDMSLDQVADTLNIEVAKVAPTPMAIMEFIEFLTLSSC